MKSTKNLPKRIKEIRKDRKISQERVAEHMNLSRQSVSNWETGRTYPDLDNLVMLSEIYDTTIDSMFENEAKAKKPDPPQEDPTPVEPLPIDPNSVIPTQEVVPEGTGVGIKEKERNEVLEQVGLAAALILSMYFPFCAIILSLIVPIWLKKTKRKYKVIYFLCCICFIRGLIDLYAFYVHMKFLDWKPYIIPVK